VVPSLYDLYLRLYAALLSQLRSPREVTKEEYHAFYKKTYNEHLEPMAYTHFNTEVYFFIHPLYITWNDSLRFVQKFLCNTTVCSLIYLHAFVL
jgi:chromosome condensin MukBEF MukE localization factor